MTKRSWRVAVVGGAALGAVALGAGPALAAPAGSGTAPSASIERSESAPVTARAVWRGAYYSYYDCDVAGFRGIYYGYWTSYNCQYRTGSSPAIWDLYA